jgi:hypothetical protein
MDMKQHLNGGIKKLLLALGVSVGLLMNVSSTSAATFDFADIADNILNPNWIGTTELEWQETAFAAGLTIGGITLVASGSNLINQVAADAFFDSGDAGLGVCSTPAAGGGSGCRSGGGTNTADDNVSAAEGGETLTLDFDTSVKFTDIKFVGANHNLANGTLFINGNPFTIISGALSAASLLLLTGTDVWNFAFDNGSSGTEFYINTATVSAVPLPAALPLFGTGLGILGFLGWRRRRKAQAV